MNYLSRRSAFASQLGDDALAIIPTHQEQRRNNDCDFPFRPDSDFHYLCGFDEPNACLVIDNTGKTMLFCQPKNIEREMWDGLRLGPDAAPTALHVDDAYSIETLDEKIPALLNNIKTLWFPFNTHSNLEKRIQNWLDVQRSKVRSGVSCPSVMCDTRSILGEMRLIKDEQELSVLREAGIINAKAHIHAMQTCVAMIRSGQDVREYHLEAALLHTFRSNGSQFPAYSSIVAAGANACILHYRADVSPIHSGELVLIDAGCELNCYASDITRVFPANGKFTPPQKLIYDVVQAAQEAALQNVGAGRRFYEPHEAAVRVLSEGMLDLGLLNKNEHGSVDEVLASKAYMQFYMHRTSHWMGMDVHDCGQYREATTPHSADARLDRMLRANMVMTIEPGIYVRPAPNVPEAFHNIGIRIEDDVVVTDDGYEILTRGVPVKTAEIEAIMAD